MMARLPLSPLAWGIAAALIVAVPQLRFAEFNSDDYSHLAVLEGIEIHRGMDSLHLYVFLDGSPDLVARRMAEGPTAWYSDPSATIRFFRPLSSALLALNHRIAGLEPLGYAIHSLLWYLLLIVLVSLLYRRIFPTPSGGGSHPGTYLALVMFALSSSNCSLVMWSATRWILISATFGLAGLIAHLRWREEGWMPGLPLSLLAFSAAFLAGEASLSVLAFLAAYEIVGNPQPLRQRVTALLPPGLLAAGYLLFYKGMGYGSTSVRAYLDPFENPAGFLVALPTKVAAMLGELFLGIPSAPWFFPAMRSGRAMAGLAAGVLVTLFIYPCWQRSARRQRRRVLWMVAGMLGSLLPLAARAPNPHILLIPFVGGAFLVSFAGCYWWRCARERLDARSGLAALAGLGFAFALLIRPPFVWFGFGPGWRQAHDQLEQFHTQSIVSDVLPGQKAVFLNFNSWALEFHGYYYRKVMGLPMPDAWWHLSRSPLEHRYRRTGANTLELEVMNGGLAAPALSRQGDVRSLPGLEITILEMGPEGITRVRFEFDHELTHSAYRFMVWRGGTLESAEVPAVGGMLVVNQATTS
jgi:hypothetical protein